MLFILSNNLIFSQDRNNQIAVLNIIHTKCIKCHNNTDYGNLNFTSTQNIYTNASLIKYVVLKKIMPPWRADTSMNCFLNDRRLNNDEIDLIRNWIPSNEYALKDQKNNANTNIENFDKLKKPDLILKLPKPFKIDGSNKDIFVTYVLNTNIKETKYISAIAIKPTNSKELHHARLEIDTTNIYNSKLNKQGYVITEDIESDSNFNNLINKPVAIYLPGLNYNKFPKNTGYPITKDDKIILHLHYAPTNIDQEDRTEIWIYYNDIPNPINVVYNNGIMLNFDILLPPDSITQVSFKSKPLKENFSIFAIQLHMHLLGKSICLKAMTPDNDTLLLLNIPKWDFNWQEYYYLKELVTLPKGTVFLTTSEFDNTTDNPNNPNIPPKSVNFYGMDTKNEMMGYICLGFFNNNLTIEKFKVLEY